MLPAEKIVVKPNFIATDPGVGGGRGGYGVFVGRLAPGEGLETLPTPGRSGRQSPPRSWAMAP